MKLGNISEVGDAAAEGLRISIIRMTATVTSGSGGSAPTPVHDNGQVTAGFTAECNNTTVATTSGSSTVLEELGWIVQQSPFETYWPDGGPVYKFRQGEALIIRCQTTPADDISIQLTFHVEEE